MWNSLKSFFIGEKYDYGYYAKEIVKYVNSYLRNQGQPYIYFLYRNNELSCYEFLTRPDYPLRGDIDGEYTMKVFSMKFSPDGNHLIGSVVKTNRSRYPKKMNQMVDYRKFQEQFFLFNYENEKDCVFFNLDIIRKIFVNHENKGNLYRLEPSEFDELLKDIVQVKPSYVMIHPSNKGLYFHLYSDWHKLGSETLNYRVLKSKVEDEYGYGTNFRKFSEKISERPEVENLKAHKKKVEYKDIIIEELTEQLNKNVSDEVRKKIQKTLDDYIFETQEKKRLSEIAKNDETAMIIVETVRNKYLEKKEDDAHG